MPKHLSGKLHASSILTPQLLATSKVKPYAWARTALRGMTQGVLLQLETHMQARMRRKRDADLRKLDAKGKACEYLCCVSGTHSACNGQSLSCRLKIMKGICHESPCVADSCASLHLLTRMYAHGCWRCLRFTHFCSDAISNCGHHPGVDGRLSARELARRADVDWHDLMQFYAKNPEDAADRCCHTSTAHGCAVVPVADCHDRTACGALRSSLRTQPLLSSAA